MPPMIAAKSSGTRASTVTARTTSSHNITSTKAGNLVSTKNKGKGRKGKKTTAAAGGEPGLTDEDDSREKEAALSSPIKGKISREGNKVKVVIISLV
jgi:hypothetical protein